MTRTTAVLIILGVTLLGLVGGLVLGFMVGMSSINEAECDGPCFAKFDQVLWTALGGAVLGGITAAVVAWRKVKRRILD